MTAIQKSDGSTGSSSGAPKKSPRTPQPLPRAPSSIVGRRTQVRRVKDSPTWFTPNADYSDIAAQFHSGVMLDVSFNAMARPMRDVICHSGFISDADATGDLIHVNSVVLMPSGIRKVCYVAFDTERRVFHDKADPSFVIRHSDYLILYTTGRAQAGWFAEFPDISSGN